MKSRVAILAALPREIRRLTRNWEQRRDNSGQGLYIYTSEDAIAVCGGMGQGRAAIASQAALRCGPVHRMISVGWAGALKPGLASGMIDRPRKVIDAAGGESYETGEAGAVLVTVPGIVNAGGKLLLAEKFSADLVDMEAAAVARVAKASGIAFLAMKAVSDEHDFDPPRVDGFVTREGQLREAAFAAHVALRPRLWKNVSRMARGSAKAACNLCIELEAYLEWDRRVRQAGEAVEVKRAGEIVG